MKLQKVINDNLHFLLPVGVLSFMGFASVFLPWPAVIAIVLVLGAIVYKKLDPRKDLPTDKTREQVTEELLIEEETKEKARREAEENKQKKKERKKIAKAEKERAQKRKQQQQANPTPSNFVSESPKTPATSAGYASEEDSDEDSDILFFAKQQIGGNDRLKKQYESKIMNSGSKQASSEPNKPTNRGKKNKSKSSSSGGN